MTVGAVDPSQLVYDATVALNTFQFIGWNNGAMFFDDIAFMRDEVSLTLPSWLMAEQPPTSGFESWIAGFPEVPTHLRGELDSPAGDGIANLIKYAFGLDPLSIDYSRMPEVKIESGELRLYYSVDLNATGLAVVPTFSKTLDSASWTPVEQQNIMHLGTDSNGIASFVATVIIEETPVFMRVEITLL
ncbi:MAG: hypothetical protein LR015_14610 [Verrucomicrobia bacterium]|nr:hypothetical protein [Verrucomicrobiota bacterium]